MAVSRTAREIVKATQEDLGREMPVLAIYDESVDCVRAIRSIVDKSRPLPEEDLWTAQCVADEALVCLTIHLMAKVEHLEEQIALISQPHESP